MDGEWGAFPAQTTWHFWIERGLRSRAACGIAMLGGDFEKAPEDLAGQRVCKACARKVERAKVKAGAADAG